MVLQRKSGLHVSRSFKTMRIWPLRSLTMAVIVVVTVITTCLLYNRGQALMYFLKSPLSTRFSSREASATFEMQATQKIWKKRNRLIVDNATAIVEKAKDMHRQNGVVLFTIVNDAFLNFTHSWCCNTASLDNVHQRVLFLTTDVQTAQRLTSVWANVTVGTISHPEFQGTQIYSKAGYVRLMVERTRLILKLLEAGVQLLLFEVDCVWLKNPMPLLLALQSTGDILATRVGGRDATAGGFLFLNPTATMIQFWQELTRQMDQLYSQIQKLKNSGSVSTAKNDQEFFSNLARKNYAGIRITFLPEELFPDGKWYSQPQKKRRESRPFLINNNWIKGTQPKRKRAYNFGHWFWEESRATCNTSALRLLDI